MDGSWSTTITAVQSADTTSRAAPEIKAPRLASVPKADDKVYAEFEALMLQNLLDAAMPKSMESLFGEGAGGSLWRSKLLEQIGRSIAERGDFRLLGDPASLSHGRSDVSLQPSKLAK